MAATKTDTKPVEAPKTEAQKAPVGKLSIFEAIPRIMAEVGPVGKDSEAKNMSGKKMFNFRGIDAVCNALNPVMAKYGVFVVPIVLEQNREERRSSNGGLLIYSIMRIQFTFYASDGSCVQAVTVGEGMDSADKASNKAMSVALKYAFNQVFAIPTEMDDPDKDVYELDPNGNNQQKPTTNPAGHQPTPPPTKQDPPANVTKTPTLPPEENPVLKYLANERSFMAQRFDKSSLEMKTHFEVMRKQLIAGGVVPNVPYDTMTMEQAKQLTEAMYSNFMTDGDKSVGKT